MFDFTGKYAVVTGGNKGIGEGIVRRFIADGAAGVAILDVDITASLEWSKEIDPSGKKILPIKCNIANRDEVKVAFEQIYGTFGKVDFLINNAGIIRDAMFHKMTDENWDLVLAVDLGGAYNCTKQVALPMRQQGSGRIIFISSISVYGNAGQANYSAAKGALVSLTKTLGKEMARKNVTVNCVVPGGVATDILIGVPGREDRPADGPRIGTPAEIAALVAFLCTDEAAYINGAAIDINGGY